MSKIDEILLYGEPIRPMLEPMVREILALVAHPPERPGDRWEGADTKFGTDAEMMDQAMEIIGRHILENAARVTIDTATISAVAAPGDVTVSRLEPTSTISTQVDCSMALPAPIASVHPQLMSTIEIRERVRNPGDPLYAAYRRGREEYGAWFDGKGSTCIDGTEPDNPYPEGTPEHEAYDLGSWDARNECVLVEMGG